MKSKEVSEYERIKSLFDDVDEKQLQLLDGLFIEASRLKVELDDMNKIIKETGRIVTNPANLKMQKELPVSKVIEKTRASYTNVITKLSSILGKSLIEEDFNDLEDYE